MGAGRNNLCKFAIKLWEIALTISLINLEGREKSIPYCQKNALKS